MVQSREAVSSNDSNLVIKCMWRVTSGAEHISCFQVDTALILGRIIQFHSFADSQIDQTRKLEGQDRLLPLKWILFSARLRQRRIPFGNFTATRLEFRATTNRIQFRWKDLGCVQSGEGCEFHFQGLWHHWTYRFCWTTRRRQGCSCWITVGGWQGCPQDGLWCQWSLSIYSSHSGSIQNHSSTWQVSSLTLPLDGHRS